MTDPVTESIADRLMDDLKLKQALKDLFDASVQSYADNGLLPQSLADEMKSNMTGAEVLKWVLTQTENAPYTRIPTGRQVVAQRELPPFHDNRPDCLDSRICALRYSSEPAICKDGFIKIIPTKD